MEYKAPIERTEIDDISMIRYYSPHYHVWHTEGMREQLDNLYHSSVSRMTYTDEGIIITAIPVETLAMRTLALRNQLDKQERAFKRHRGNLEKYMQNCTPTERQQVKKYLRKGFYELRKDFFYPERLPKYPIIDYLKRELYEVEQRQRKLELVKRRTRHIPI